MIISLYFVNMSFINKLLYLSEAQTCGLDKKTNWNNKILTVPCKLGSSTWFNCRVQCCVTDDYINVSHCPWSSLTGWCTAWHQWWISATGPAIRHSDWYFLCVCASLYVYTSRLFAGGFSHLGRRFYSSSEMFPEYFTACHPRLRLRWRSIYVGGPAKCTPGLF